MKSLELDTHKPWFVAFSGHLRLLVACLLAGAAAQAALAQPHRATELDIAPLEHAASHEACGTSSVYLQALGLVTATPLADGEPLMADQNPRILTPDHTGNFIVAIQIVGDHSTIQFERSASDTADSAIETWTRTSTRTVDGLLISIFEKTYPDTELAGTLRRQAWGFDNGGLAWGDVISPGSGTRSSLALRIGSTNIPTAAFTSVMQRVQLADDVQWAGSVVNVRIPGFGDSRVTDGEQAFGLKAAAKKFYEYFPDSYDSIAFVPQSQAFTTEGAFHINVKNDVTGIGMDTFDNTPGYGSAGTLKSVEVYPQTSFTTHDMSNHQIMHQWGHYLDLVGIAGVEAQGFKPATHAPLTEGTTLAGAVLDGSREVFSTSDAPAPQGSDFEIGRSPHPIRYHPVEMYVLGKIPIEQLGTQLIFQDQGQFGNDRNAPQVGTRLQGSVEEVTTGAILGRHGSRGGPSPTEWRRATVVVSRDALLSDEEMSYYSFFAQRLADPDGTGVPSYEGFVSFDAATQNTVDLQTDVTSSALTGVAPGSTLVEVTAPEFGRRDWRGVEFYAPVPSRFSTNRAVQLTGRVTATDRTDFNEVLIRFWKSGGNSSDAVRVLVPVSRAGTFAADVQFSGSQRGLYSMEVFLLWSNAPPQSARTRVTPILVE